MTLKEPKIGNLQTPQESPIMTSDTNKEVKKRIAHYELSAFFFGDPGGIRTPDPRLRRNNRYFLCILLNSYNIYSSVYL